MLQTVNDQGRLERMLFGLKIATVVVRYGNTASIPNTIKWLNNVVTDAIPVYLPRDNNLKAWCILTIAITGLAINNNNLVQTAVGGWYDVCNNHILDSGEMPAEKKRTTRSEKYHEYACEPMVMATYWLQKDHPRLHALVNYVLSLDRTQLPKQMPWLVLYNQQFGLSKLTSNNQSIALKELNVLKQDPMYICKMGGNIYWQI
jgi:Alginate lyase